MVSDRIKSLKFMQHAEAKARAKATTPQHKHTASTPTNQNDNTPHNLQRQQHDAQPQTAHKASTHNATTQAATSLQYDTHASRAVLSFNPARRSFGAFNPALDARLADLAKEKSAAAAALAAEEEEARESARRRAEFAELRRKADAQEEVEKKSSVSDEKMAQYYSKLPSSGQRERSLPEAAARPKTKKQRQK